MIDGPLLFIGGGSVPLIIVIRTVFQYREALSDRQEAHAHRPEVSPGLAPLALTTAWRPHAAAHRSCSSGLQLQRLQQVHRGGGMGTEASASGGRPASSSREAFNTVRLHQALDDTVPAGAFATCPHPMLTGLPMAWYLGYYERRKVSNSGTIRLKGWQLFVSSILARLVATTSTHT